MARISLSSSRGVLQNTKLLKKVLVAKINLNCGECV
jgi:hypothetical protein